MGTQRKREKTAQGMETLSKCKEIYKDNPGITPKTMAYKVGLTKRYIIKIWDEITGMSWVDDLKTRVRALLMVFPDAKIEEAAERFGVELQAILTVWNDVLNEIKESNDDDEDLKGCIQIPEFVPHAKKYVDRDGKTCTDVSEFFGIVENGGDCYKNVRFTIPKGCSSSYGNHVSDFYI